VRHPGAVIAGEWNVRAAALAPRRVDEQVIESAHEPGARIRDGAEVVEPRARAETNFLHEILGVGPPPREPHRRAMERREVRLHQAREPLLD
jgi:hypothetical protein